VTEFRGSFEMHITIAVPSADEWARLSSWGVDHKAKCVWIELARGLQPSQPMVTVHRSGALVGIVEECQSLEAELRNLGLTPVRTKVECAIDNDGVPRDDADWGPVHAGRYFESHVKLLLNASEDLPRIRQLAERHDGHLSRNAFRTREDGRQERFVTQRGRGCGRRTFQERIDALVRTFEATGVSIAEIEREFVVFDTREGLDSGWLTDSQ
jgi:hypothetical protein